MTPSSYLYCTVHLPVLPGESRESTCTSTSRQRYSSPSLAHSPLHTQSAQRKARRLHYLSLQASKQHQSNNVGLFDIATGIVAASVAQTGLLFKIPSRLSWVSPKASYPSKSEALAKKKQRRGGNSAYGHILARRRGKEAPAADSLEPVACTTTSTT